MVSWSLTSSGIILCFVPPLNDPTVITASSKGLIFLLTIVWSSITIKEAFPFWLAPIQMTILSISDKFNLYSDKIFKSLSKLNLRVIQDIRSEKISKKIRDAELKKIPYMIIIGENELKSNKISLRKHTEGDLGKMTLDDLISTLKKEKNVIINN